MPNNFDSLFNNRIAQELERNLGNGVSSKYQELEIASQEKIIELQRSKEAQLAVQAANKKAFIGKLGLGQESVIGGTVNVLAASVADAAAPLGIDMDASVAANEHTGLKDSSVQRRVGDVGISALKSAIAVPETVVGLASMVTGGHAGKILNDAGFRPEEAKAFLDTLYSHEQKAANDNVHGAEGFWNTMNQIAENPSTVPHALMESLFPMLAGGVAARGLQALGMAVKASTAAGEGVVMAGSAAENIRQQTKDKLLGIKEVLPVIGTGLIGAAVGRGGMAVSNKAGFGDIDEAVARGILGKSKHGVLTNTLGSGAIEAGEEGLQSTAETMLQNLALDKELTAGVGNAAAIGMVTGAAMGAPMGAAQVVSDNLASKQSQAANTAAINAAIPTNDTAAFLDKTAATYSPSNAVAVLLGNSQLEATTPEAKAANVAQANQIVLDLAAEVQAAKEQQAQYKDITPQEIADLKLGLTAATDALNAADPANTAEVARITEGVEYFTNAIDAAENPTTDAQITTMEADLVRARKVTDAFGRISAPKGDTLAKHIDTVNAEVDKNDAVAVKASQTSADEIINLSMRDPGAVSGDVLAQLASNPKSVLTKTQANTLRILSEARRTENALKKLGGVSAEIYEGSGKGSTRKYVGIVQYRQRMGEAVAANNQKTAVAQLKGLGTFAAAHASKAKAATESLSSTKQIVFDQATKTWVVPATRMSAEAVKANGGLDFNSPKLYDSIQTEAAALTAANAELVQMYRNTFGKPAPVQKTPVSTKREQPEKVKPAEPVLGGVAGATPTQTGKAEANQKAAPVTENKVAEAKVTDIESAPSTEQTSPAPLINRTAEDSGGKPRVEEVPSTPVQAEATKDKDTSTAPVVVMETVAPEGSTYRELRLGNLFSQASNAQNPLTSVKDYLSQLVAGVLSVTGSTAQQVAALEVFQKVATRWNQKITANLIDRQSPLYNYNDMMQYFILPNGDIDENVKTALSFAAFSYVADNSNEFHINTNDKINGLLGRDADAPMVGNEREILGDVHATQNIVIRTLGERAVKALGLKAKVNTPISDISRLTEALGAHALRLLVDSHKGNDSLFVQKEIPVATIKGFTSDTEVVPPGAVDTMVFLTIRRNEDNTPISRAQYILEATRGSQNVVNKLFDVEATKLAPTFEPVTKLEKFLKRSKQLVPAAQNKIIAGLNKQANFLRQDKLHLLDALGDETFLEIMGVVEVDQETTHADNVEGIEAKNDGLRRELAGMREFIDDYLKSAADGLGQAFYFEHYAMKQQRVSIKNNLINPQSSKLHRFMIYRQSWETEVDSNDQDQLDNFWLRVAEGMGIKTDKNNRVTALAEVQKIYNSETVQAALVALNKSIYDGTGLSEDEKAVIVSAAKQGGEKAHSLDALVGMVEYSRAQKAGTAVFKVNMLTEVDGVANGHMLSLILMGAANSVEELFHWINRGGFFEKGSAFTQYNNWRSTIGNNDMYETIARNVLNNLNLLTKDGIKIGKRTVQIDPAMARAVSMFMGKLENSTGGIEKDGRAMVKTPLTAIVYGSSMSTALNNMAGDFIDSIRKKMEKLAQQNQTDPVGAERTRKKMVKVLQDLGIDVDSKVTVQELLDHKFTSKELKTLTSAFVDTYGEAVKITIKTDMAKLLDNRKKFNKTAELLFDLANNTYEALRKEYIKELIQAEKDVPGTGIAFSTSKAGEDTAIHDLNKTQQAELEQRLADVMPSLQTAFSNMDNAPAANTGVRVGKMESQSDYGLDYQNEVKFGTQLPNGAKSIKVHGERQVAAKPGVSLAGNSTHSTDSAISHTAMNGEVLNLHDAHGVGAHQLVEAGRNLNEATWKNLLAYSPSQELYTSLMRTITGLNTLLSNKDTPESVRYAILDTLLQSDTNLLDAAQNAKYLAFEADQIRYEAMAQMGSIAQYAVEGGNYEVTEADRAEAQAKYDALDASINEADMKVLDSLSKLIGESVESKPIIPTILVEGTPVVTGDSRLVESFKMSPVQSAKGVLKNLILELTGRKLSNIGGFNRELMMELWKRIPADLNIRMVTPETLPEDILDAGEPGAHGWYVSKGNKQEIYVLSPDFAHSSLTQETVIHEVVHAILARLIKTETEAKAADSSYTSEVSPLIDELERLRKKASEYAVQNALDAKFAEPLKNIQEFVAWGMSNLAFQTEILNAVTTQPRTKQTGLVKMAKAFIDTITGILFTGSNKNAQQLAVNGMTILINNVSGLFEAASKSGTGGDINLSALGTAPITYTTQSLYSGLNSGSITAAFEAKLVALLDGIVENLHGPYGSFMAPFMSKQTLSAEDLFYEAQTTGIAPFASQSLAAGFKISSKEAFVLEQVEATVRASLDDANASTSTAYRELSKLYQEAYNALPVESFYDGVWAQATQAEKDEAQALHDFVFKIQSNGNKLDHLSRFAALGLAHEKFSKMLGFNTEVKPTKANPTIVERLQGLLDFILDIFHTRITATYAGQKADDKLNSLVQQLAGIEAKRAIAEIRRANANASIIDHADDMLKGAVGTVTGKLEQFGKSGLFQNRKNAVIKLAGKTLSTVAGNRTALFLQGMAKFATGQSDTAPGLVAGMINNIGSPQEDFDALLRGAKHQQKLALHVNTQTAAFLMSGFENNGRDLTEEQKGAITAVFVRTGAHILLGHYSMEELVKLMSSKKLLDQAIQAEIQKLNKYPKFVHYFAKQALVLGYNKANGKTKGEIMMQNAGNIARLYLTPFQSKITEAEAAAAEPIIDRLITLNALLHSKHTNMAAAIGLLQAQPEAVKAVMEVHKDLESQSKDGLFVGQEALMMKGYAPDITNPHIDITAADNVDGQELLYQGYHLGAVLKNDAHDPDMAIKNIYILRDGGKQPLQTGILSYQGTQAKGKTLHNGNRNSNTFVGTMNIAAANQMLADKQRAILDMFKPDPGFNPAKVDENYQSPIVNGQGGIANWRYMMEDSTKDNLMERNNSFADVLGAMAGSVYDKKVVTPGNTKLVQAMYDMYKKEIGTSPDEFILVSDNSTDPAMQEIYRMIPEATKEVINSIWGKGGMLVRKDLLDISFGYHKLSMANMFTQDKGELNPLELGFIMAIEHIVKSLDATGNMRAKLQGLPPIHDLANSHKRVPMLVRKYERIWQEIVKETKDVIVVKTGTVMMVNIMSNIMLLKMNGVPTRDIIKWHLAAFNGARDYHRENNQVFQLEAKIATGITGTELVKAEREVALLKDALERNPVKGLMDAGLMPTIAEDVESANDIYSYKSEFVRKTEKFTSKLNPSVVAAGKAIYMARDTKGYQFLTEVTQLSDFVARYTLYQHLTTHGKTPMGSVAAIQKASESFVNYDKPMHRKMQYSDDMGLTMFTKYFMGIQRVILDVSREHPGSVLATLLMANLLDVTTVMDASVINRIGNNPFTLGAFNYFGALDELATVNAAVSVF